MNKVLEPLVNTAHTLIAGTTGSGKSVLLNDVLLQLEERVDNYDPVICSMFDLKRVELIDHADKLCCRNVVLNEPVGYITEPEDVLDQLDFVVYFMECRYKEMADKHVKFCDDFPYYAVIDELADLLTVPGALERLVKIGRLGRAANVHLLCCTQDPSRRNLPAQLMQNFTCCVALRCRSAIESRQIIGVSGAEKLPKYGRAIRWDADGLEEFEVPFLK